METSLIERLDKSRYNLLKWTTIGWAIWFATIIGNNFEKGHIFNTIATFIGLLGSTIWAINFIKYRKFVRELRWNRRLDKALNNEVHVFNVHRSFQIGYLTMIVTSSMGMLVSIFIQIPALLVTELILYFGLLSSMISLLYYNRD